MLDPTGKNGNSNGGLLDLARDLDLDLFGEDVLREVTSPTFLVLSASLCLALLVSCCLICLICARLCCGSGGSSRGGGSSSCCCYGGAGKDGYQVREAFAAFLFFVTVLLVLVLALPMYCKPP